MDKYVGDYLHIKNWLLLNTNGEVNTTLSTMDITNPKVVALTQVETEKSNDTVIGQLLAA